jgi:hypothetical protein
VDYGLDAPPVVRNLFLAAALGLVLWLAAALHIWSGAVRLSLGATDLRMVLAPAAFSIGVSCPLMALWMIGRAASARSASASGYWTRSPGRAPSKYSTWGAVVG